MTHQGTILVIGDTRANLTQLMDTLAAEGYQVLSEDSGEGALASVAARPPELILLDLGMPGLDGCEVYRGLRTREASRGIPVVLIRASRDHLERVEGLKLGMVDFITTLFHRQELLARVQTHLELGRLRVRLEAQTAALRLAKEQLRSDIAERKRAEEALQASEGRLRAITDSAQDAILVMDPEGRISYWNPGAARIFGYTSTEALAQNLHDLIAPARFHSAHRAALPAFRQTGRGAAIGKTLDLEARRKDGREISVQLSLSAVQMDGDWHAVGLVRDVTERKQAAEALLRSETKFRTLYDSSSDAVMLLDQQGFLDCNPATLALFGYATRDEFCAQHLADVSPPVQPDGTDSQLLANQCIATAMEQGRHQFEWLHRRAHTGETFPAEVLLTAMELDGKPVFQAVVRDITERKQIQAQREFLIKNLEEALDDVKSLSGLLPICAGCKKIRDDRGYWSQVESYIQKHSDATFTHGLCPDCIRKYFPDVDEVSPADSPKEAP